MAWNPPAQFNSGAPLTAAQLNQIRDCLLETSAAKATTAGRYYVSGGLNSLVERTPVNATINTAETTNQTGYGDLATVGPEVTATTGTSALVLWSTRISVDRQGDLGYASIAIGGASTFAASDSWAMNHEQSALTGTQGTGGSLAIVPGDITRFGTAYMFTALTPGVNNFVMQYRSSNSAANVTFQYRQLTVLPF